MTKTELTEAELRALIADHPVDGSPDQRRRAFEALAAAAGAANEDGVTIAEGGGDAPYTIITPDDAASTDGAPIVHFHGGGYVFGSPASHRAFGIELAKASRRVVVLTSYPLAPEHVWPAQREGAMAFLRAIGPPYVLSGDSAGGHLALSCALGGAEPDALILFSPNTSRAYGRSATRGCAADAMNDHATDDRLAALAFGGTRAADADQTLVDQSLAGLPPVYIDIGQDEILRGDADAFIEAALRDGVDVTVKRRAGFHMIQLFAAAYPPGHASLVAAGRWLMAQKA